MGRKHILTLVIILMVLFTLPSCSPKVAEPKDATLQINPIAESVNREQVTTRLYFGYLGEQLLVGENRVFDAPDTESREKSIIQELIKGPSVVRTDFTQLINSSTKVVNVESQDQFLFVTLSKEFLEPASGEFDPTDEEQAEMEKTRKYLAVYSIVNTLVEQGTYSRVSILIDEDGNGRMLTKAEAGIEGGSDPTAPFERNGAIALSSSNTMREILSAIERKDWNYLYGYISNKNSYDYDKPTIEDFRNEVTKVSVSNYEVLDDVTAQDGSSAVVLVNYDLKLADGETRKMINIPVRLAQEKDVWKITYNVFKSKFMV